jgi:DNA-binding LytR/AlgR family response regulator
LRRDFKTSLLGWGGFIALLSCYCMMYQVVVDDVPADLASAISITEVFKNWGVWLVTTPAIFAALRKYSSKWHDRAVELVALIFLPRYVAAVGIVYLVWHVFLRERRVPAETVDVAPSPATEIEHTPPAPATLLVSKGADQCLIRIGRIESVSAAGNYVEIVERGQRYLMRATLKQIEDLLPATEFIRIHRCHLVRRDEIERIKSQPSGNGTVQLRGGQTLPMSKKHKQSLQRYRPAE